MDEIICVHETFDVAQADLIKALLEGMGISCYLKTDDGGGTMPHLTFANGIQVMVREEDAERAEAAIQHS